MDAMNLSLQTSSAGALEMLFNCKNVFYSEFLKALIGTASFAR
jgi:hypothetical protein